MGNTINRLSGLPIQNDIASLTAYTTVDSVATTQAQLQTPSPFPFDNGQPKNELIQPDGKHLVSGYYNGNWAIARYNSDGMLDLSFGGGDGKATVDFGTPSDRALTLHLQSDGKIVLMGLVGAANDTWTVAAARLNADGTLDSTFADNGKLLSGLGRAPTYGAVWSILNDGRIHITGWDGGKSVGMEYNSDGKDGFDRLAAINEIHASSAQPTGALSIQPPARGTIGWYGVRGQALGPYIVNGGKLRAQDIGLTTGDPYEAGLPDGTGRTLSWGDGATDSVSDPASSATHTYTTAGTFMTTATGQWASLGGQMSFHPTPAVGQPDASGPAEVVRADDANLADGDVVDLDNHDLAIDQPTASFTTVRQWVFDGVSATVDPDKTGIISTAGQSEGGSALLELFDNSLVHATEYPAGSGKTIGANAIVGKYTYLGDTNWDGKVTADDYDAVDSNYGRTDVEPGLAWFDGDNNYDGMVTADDYGTFDANFGLGTSGSGTPTLVAGSDDAPLSLETVDVRAAETGPLSAPTNVEAVASGASDEPGITIAWDAVTGATGYVLERASDSSFSSGVVDVPITGDATSYDDADLAGTTAGDTLYYQVKATNDGGESSWSSTATADAPATLPGSPSSLYPVAIPHPGASDDVLLTWRGGSGTSQFQIDRATDETFASSTTVDVPPVLTLVGLGGSGMYPQETDPFTIAGSLQFNSFRSDDLSIIIGSSETISVDFDDSSSPAHYTVTLPDDAIILRDNESGGYFGNGNGTYTTTIRNVSNTSSYEFTVDEGHIIDMEGGDHPFQTRDASEGVSEDELRSRGWIGSLGLPEMKMAWVGDEGHCYATVAGSLQWYLDSPGADDTYYYRVTAVNGSLSAQSSQVGSVTTPGSAPSDAGDSFVDAIDSTSNGIDWSDESNNEAGFEIWRSDNSSFTSPVLVTTTAPNVNNFVDTTASPSITQYYKVKAKNGFATQSTASSSQMKANQIEVLCDDGVVRLYGATATTSSRLTYPFGSAVHVQLSPTEVKKIVQVGTLSPTGTITNTLGMIARFTWNFRENSTDHIYHGYNAAYVYTTSGTHQIVLTVETPTTSAVGVVTYTATVTTDPESALTSIKVSNTTGTFSGSAGTYTLAGAISKLDTLRSSSSTNHDIELQFHKGETFTLATTATAGTGSISLGSLSDVLVTSYGSGGVLPVLLATTSTSGKYDPFFEFPLGVASRNITVQNMDFRSDNTDPNAPQDAAPYLLHLEGSYGGDSSNISLRNSKLHNVRGETITSKTGFLFQNNQSFDSSQVEQVKYYTLYSRFASEVVIVDNPNVGGVRWQSDFRLEQNTFVLFENNTVLTGHRSALRMESGYSWVEKNRLTSSGNWLGPLPGGNGSDENRNDYLIFDSNVLDDYRLVGAQNIDAGTDKNLTRIDPGLTHAVIRNNIFIGASNIFMGAERTRLDAKQQDTHILPKPNYIASDIWIVNNTRVNASDRPFLQYDIKDGGADLYLRFKNLHFANNLSAVTSSSIVRYPDGVSLKHIPSSSEPLWYKELTRTNPAGDTSQWWVAHNVWQPDSAFMIDGSSIGNYAAWNSIVLPSGTDKRANKLNVGVIVDGGYFPKTALVQFGSRLIVGDPAMEVAAWDYIGDWRPTAVPVSAGAVERHPIG